MGAPHCRNEPFFEPYQPRNWAAHPGTSSSLSSEPDPWSRLRCWPRTTRLLQDTLKKYLILKDVFKYVCMNMYVYIIMYIYIYIYVYIRIYTYMCILYIYICIYIYIYMFMYIYIYVYVYIYIYVCLCIYIYICVCMYTLISVWQWLIIVVAIIVIIIVFWCFVSLQACSREKREREWQVNHEKPL